jgi:hypothetical protein
MSIRRSCATGSQVGSHSLRTPPDGGGRLWTWKPALPGPLDVPGHLWTPLGDLRIRRLGVQVSPGVLPGTPVSGGGSGAFGYPEVSSEGRPSTQRAMTVMSPDFRRLTVFGHSAGSAGLGDLRDGGLLGSADPIDDVDDQLGLVVGDVFREVAVDTGHVHLCCRPEQLVSLVGDGDADRPPVGGVGDPPQ